jgi:hypothetical protein
MHHMKTAALAMRPPSEVLSLCGAEGKLATASRQVRAASAADVQSRGMRGAP